MVVIRRRAGAARCSASAQTVFSVRVATKLADVPASEWDSCAPAALNPFVSHGFLSALEESGSVTPRTGWAPQHLLLYASSDGAPQRLVGCAPLYLKAHSMGEYVFDQSWAAAAQRGGLAYYPKLQTCVPFSPVPGPRLLLRPDAPPGSMRALAAGLRGLCDDTGVSGCHVTFCEAVEGEALRQEGFLPRVGMQYHFENKGYSSFDGQPGGGSFLQALTQSRRKSIRQERKQARRPSRKAGRGALRGRRTSASLPCCAAQVAASGLRMARPRGAEISASMWDTFYEFYRFVP